MKISVVIPAYNCAATIQATLDSVLQQTVPADEILVMDDGSTDETAAILKLYEQQIKAFRQPNGGLSSARNALIAKAQGDLIAFLDSDDIWHPRYLEVQRELFQRCPTAAAAFAAHVDFCGLDSPRWSDNDSDGQPKIEVFEPLSFLQRYLVAPGPFVMSFCCVPRRVLEGIGSEPFKLKVAEDVYFCHLLPFWGPVALASAPAVAAYRIRGGSLGSNRLNCTEGEVKGFELVESHYRDAADARLVRQFQKAFASKRRAYAKILLGLGRTSEARSQLRRSLSHSGHPVSVVKSVTLLSLSYLPTSLQPGWPSIHRQWKASDSRS